MFTSQLNHLINSDLKLKNNFVGVFPRDKLPNLDKGSCLILNTHDSFKEGEHWLAINVDALGKQSTHSMTSLTSLSRFNHTKKHQYMK